MAKNDMSQENVIDVSVIFLKSAIKRLETRSPGFWDLAVRDALSDLEFVRQDLVSLLEKEGKVT